MNSTTRFLAPGEKLVYRLQRNQHWFNLLVRFLGDALILFLVWRLFHYLNRSFIESYIAPWSTLGRSSLIAVNLFLSLVPFLVFLALAQDFIYTFFIELNLTDQRIAGRVGGLFWLKDINLPLEQVRDVTIQADHICIRRVDGAVMAVYGFSNGSGFVDAFQHQQYDPYSSPEELDLPDAFTFQHAR